MAKTLLDKFRPRKDAGPLFLLLGCKGPVPLLVKALQTTIDPLPPFIVGMVHFGRNSSPGHRLTCLAPSEPNLLNLDL